MSDSRPRQPHFPVSASQSSKKGEAQLTVHNGTPQLLSEENTPKINIKSMGQTHYDCAGGRSAGDKILTLSRDPSRQSRSEAAARWPDQ